MAKFKLTAETKHWFGRTLYRIEALIDFGSVKTGDKGGWVETEANLSQNGEAWISDEARVSGEARVYGKAWVSGEAWVSGKARVSGEAWVSDEAWVSGEAQVYGKAWVSGEAQVTPICVSGLEWPVTITDQHMRIGCQHHLISDWAGFDDRTITEMDGRSALTFWRRHKEQLLALCAATGRPMADQVAKPTEASK